MWLCNKVKLFKILVKRYLSGLKVPLSSVTMIDNEENDCKLSCFSKTANFMYSYILNAYTKKKKISREQYV